MRPLVEEKQGAEEREETKCCANIPPFESSFYPSYHSIFFANIAIKFLQIINLFGLKKNRKPDSLPFPPGLSIYHPWSLVIYDFWAHGCTTDPLWLR
jgi:hypothetical protein